MRITIEYYGQKVTWESKYGTDGIPFVDDKKIDETPMDEIVEKFAALLIASGWMEQTIKDNMYDYGRTESIEEV